MWQELFSALALVLILEGLFPFIAPRAYRRVMLSMVQQHEKVLRTGGFIMMILGVIFLYWVR